MARNKRSSGANSVSLLGVILPTRMSPGLTSAPMRMTPSRPRLFNNDLRLLHRVTARGEDFLIDAGRRVRAHELADLVDVDSLGRVMTDLLFALGQFAVLGDDDLIAGHRGDLAGFLGDDDGAG